VSLQLNSKTLTLTDQTAPMQVRLLLHESACRLFTTARTGSDGYHEDHIHLTLPSGGVISIVNGTCTTAEMNGSARPWKRKALVSDSDRQVL
jgi:hypothetical protein